MGTKSQREKLEAINSTTAVPASPPATPPSSSPAAAAAHPTTTTTTTNTTTTTATTAITDVSQLPDWNETFINPDDIAAFTAAIHAPPDPASSQRTQNTNLISAHNDWHPIHQRIRRPRPRRSTTLSSRRDEAREGFVYTLLKYPLLILVAGWLAVLSLLYALTRFYISQYEYWVTWRGERKRLRDRLRRAETYEQWCEAAAQLDRFLGSEKWKEVDEFAYYDSATVRKIVKGLKEVRARAETGEEGAIEELRVLVELAGKNNFAGVESGRLYSQTYLGTKNLVQEFVDEGGFLFLLLLYRFPNCVVLDADGAGGLQLKRPYHFSIPPRRCRLKTGARCSSTFPPTTARRRCASPAAHPLRTTTLA